MSDLAGIGEALTLSFTLLSMSKRAFQVVVALVVFFATLTPLANCFDTWDKGAAAAPANDAELHLTAWVVGAGFVVVMTKLMRCIPLFAGEVKRINRPRQISICSAPVFDRRPEPTSSPPVIALRI